MPNTGFIMPEAVWSFNRICYTIYKWQIREGKSMEYVNAKEYFEQAVNLRFEMINNLSCLPGFEMDEPFREITRRFFADGDQTTLLAVDNGEAVACATICYVTCLPTRRHQTGKRAHIMNVYTRAAYRRQGIGKRLVQMLISEAREKGVTHMSLDATDMGRPLYEGLGFHESEEYLEISF